MAEAATCPLGGRQRCITIRAALLAGIGFLVVLVVGAATQRLLYALDVLETAETAVVVNDCSDLLVSATAHWARERGLVFKALNNADPIGGRDREQIAGARAASAGALNDIRDHPKDHRLLQEPSKLLDELFAAHERVAQLRSVVDGELQRPADQRDVDPETWFAATSDLIMAARRLSLALAGRVERDTGVARAMAVRDAAWALSEFTGRERGLASGLIASGEAPDAEDLVALGGYRGWISSTLQTLRGFRGGEAIGPALRAAVAQVEQAYQTEFADLRRDVRPLLSGDARDPSRARAWFDGSSAIIETVIDLQRTAADVARREAARREAASTTQARLHLVLVALTVLIGAASMVFVVVRVIRPLETTAQAFQALASGRSDVAIPASGRGDEIGTLTRAVLAFKATMIERQRLEEEILARRRTEAELRQAKNAAEAANLAKSRFLANVSHELRTPLNGVLGFAELLEHEYVGPLNPRQAGYVADIGKSGRHLLSLIDDVLDISKAEAGEFVLHEERVSVDQVVSMATSFVAEDAAKRGIVLEPPPRDTGLCFHGDQRVAIQMLANLLSNAVKFTEPGGEVRVEAERRLDGGVRLAVRDTGIGMDEAEITTALDVFGQVRKDAQENEPGRGLGLPLVQRMAALHDAELRIDSAPGRGTTVTLDFPTNRNCIQ